jgi:hypothetical protein
MRIDANMKTKPFLVCCSVLKDEIDQLSIAKDFNIIFLGMTLHSNCELLEQKLNKVLKKCGEKSPRKIILVYGDYCLGSNDEMKKLAKKYNAAKVDALNCIDCLLGGKGNYLKVDPESKMIFLSPGWIKYFDHYLKSATREEQSLFRTMFGGLEGIVLLDTLGNLRDCEDRIEKFVDFTELKILKTKKIDIENLKILISHSE